MSKKNKLFKKGAGINKKELKKIVLDYCYTDPTQIFNYKQVCAHVKVNDPVTRQLVNVVLQELTDDGYLLQQERGKFQLKEKTGYVIGKLEMTQKGYGFLISEELDEDVFIAGSSLNRALNGDKVRVFINAQRKKKQPEGEVVEIIERAKTSFVGVLNISKNYAFLVPSGKNNFDIFIPKDKLMGATQGQKAVAKITDWPQHAKNPFGEIVDVLGDVGHNDTEMHAILAEFDLPYKFPEKVDNVAEKLSVEITAEEISKRRDFRNIPTFTIDPHDAKDFDDALSIQKLPNGLWEIGVHIADVSHYVEMNGIIDKEAEDRATSVYMVDRVVPMLPEKLSNGVCSLRPQEEKLCFSAVFELDDDAQVHKQWFGRTVIFSDYRFDYAEAQAVIDSGDGAMKSEVLTLHNLAQKLKELRYKSGAISFDRVEVKFDLDENGKPIGVFFKEAKESNQLIEEFMLLANKKVAEFIGKPKDKSKAKTFVYRIHDKPDPDKLENFNNFIKKFGYGIDLGSQKNLSQSMNSLLKNVKGSHEENMISNLAVRAMAKAVYSTRNIGHYGLSFEYYTHFTSPIRRFPDLMVHRLLARYLDGGRSVNAETYEEKCRHSSNMEQRAVQAERASIKYKQVEYMQDKVGQVFDGVISGVTDWGIYVELNESKCEGMISMKDLKDDFYFFDEKNYCITGMHSQKTYQLGADVKIEVMRANLDKKQLDFKLVEELKEGEVPHNFKPVQSAKTKQGKSKNQKKKRY
ncbi:MAG: ribonuclease R [Prolixibacteraceae bacterium]